MSEDDIVPLPVLWTIDIAPAMSGFAPLLVEGAVIVRVGLTIACLDDATGEMRWSFALPSDAGSGRVFARSGDRVVVDLDGHVLLALTLDGHEAWRTPRLGEVPLYGVASFEGRVYALSFASPFDETLLGFDAATGAEVARVHLGGGFAEVIAVPDGLLLGRHSVSDGRGGLAWVDRDGGGLRVLEAGACWAVAVDGDRIVAITRGPDEAPRVAMRGGWSLPIDHIGLAFDGRDVLVLDAGGVVLVDAGGSVRWRKPPEPDDDEVGELALVGPLAYVSTYGSGALRRRSDGAALGPYYGFGPPVARGDRLFLHTPTGAMCASLAQIDAG